MTAAWELALGGARVTLLEREPLRRYIDERLPGMLEECGRLALLSG